MAQSMWQPPCTRAFLQLGSAAHRYWHRKLFSGYMYSKRRHLNRTLLFSPAANTVSTGTGTCFPKRHRFNKTLLFALCRNYCTTWNRYMHKECKTAQGKLASPMTSMSTRRSRKTLSVVANLYLMNSNWVFSLRGPYNSSSSR